jgi:hypothetical protein
MIATIWTDDVRYFGTEEMLDEYEKELQKHISTTNFFPCTFKDYHGQI